MNADFGYIYKRVLTITGLRNRSTQIKDLISQVTMGEHMRRKYKKDSKLSVWSSDMQGDDGSSNVGDSNQGCGGSNKPVYELKVSLPKTSSARGLITMEIVSETSKKTITPADVVDNRADVILAKLGTFAGIKVTEISGEYMIKSDSPILYVGSLGASLPDVSENGYNSWIGAGQANSLYNSVIIHGVAAQALDDIGAKNAGTQFQLYASAQVHLQRDAEHYG